MQKLNKILFYVFSMMLVLPPFVYADKIYLKDGKSYEGKLIGKSQRRYLFSVIVDSESFRMSFFPEDVEKIELGKDTVEEQIPYLKEVETFNVDVKEDKTKSYQLSLYKDNQAGGGDYSKFSEKELQGSLDKQEKEYYARFNDILSRYVDKLQFVQNLYLNLPVATKDEFLRAKQYMDELYFELNNIFVPVIFKKSHTFYLQSVKAGYLTFNALLNGMLDEASKQIKVSEEAKQYSGVEFRKAMLARISDAQASKEAGSVPQDEKEECRNEM